MRVPFRRHHKPTNAAAVSRHIGKYTKRFQLGTDWFVCADVPERPGVVRVEIHTDSSHVHGVTAHLSREYAIVNSRPARFPVRGYNPSSSTMRYGRLIHVQARGDT